MPASAPLESAQDVENAAEDTRNVQRPDAASPSGSGGESDPAQRKRKRKAKHPLWNKAVDALKQHRFDEAWQYWEEVQSSDSPYGRTQVMMFAAGLLGMEDWSSYLHRASATSDGTPPRVELPLERAQAVLQAVDAMPQLEHDEQRYCMHARMAALQWRPEAALEHAEACVADEQAIVRLRTYLPALAVYGLQGNVDGVMRVRAAIRRHGSEISDMTETEFEYLLQALCKAEAYDELQSVLLDMGDLLTVVNSRIQCLLKDYFSGPLGAAALKGQQVVVGGQTISGTRWDVTEVAVDSQGDGNVPGAGHLREVSLKAADWLQFQKGLHDLASKRERQAGCFQEFAAFLEQRDFTVFLDAANIAYYGNSTKPGSDVEKFQWSQVQAVYAQTTARFPDRKVLVIVHSNRRHPRYLSKKADFDFVTSLERSGNLWLAPRGSNDDWYWLYGTVSAGHRGVLVSNDLMRDHIFELLRPRYFEKWRTHHRFTYDWQFLEEGRGIRWFLSPPDAFTTCVQQLPESGAWMIPQGDSKWLCARPV